MNNREGVKMAVMSSKTSRPSQIGFAERLMAEVLRRTWHHSWDRMSFEVFARQMRPFAGTAFASVTLGGRGPGRFAG
jgi:hypothetical protein